jgi:hypothetical protein
MRLGLRLEQRLDVKRLADGLARRVRQAGDDLAAAVAEVRPVRVTACVRVCVWWGRGRRQQASGCCRGAVRAVFDGWGGLCRLCVVQPGLTLCVSALLAAHPCRCTRCSPPTPY